VYRDGIELPTPNARKSIALVVVGTSLYLTYLYHVGFSEIADSMRSVDLRIFSLGFILALLGVLFDGLAWRRVAIKFDCSMSVSDAFLMYLSCIFLNNLIPSGSFSGETARIYFLEKLASPGIDRSSATVAATRIITAVPFFFGIAIGMVYLVFETNAPAWAIATCSGIAFVLFGINAIFVGICFSSGWLEGIISRLIEFIEKVFNRRVDRNLCIGIVRRFHSAMNGFTEHRWTIIVSSAWAFAAWFCMNLVAFVTFKSMGIEVSMWAIFAVYAVMIFIQMLPLVLPGGIGLVDIVMITLFSAIGVPTSYAVAATILSRLIQLWFLTIAGGAATAYLLKRIDKTSQLKMKHAA